MIYILKNDYKDKEFKFVKPPIEAPNGGHMSMYGYEEDIVEYYKKNNSLYGFANTNPSAYSSVYYVDFDDNEEKANEFLQFCKQKRYTFKVYSSGNRSIHYHIRREPLSSPNLPYSDKRFAVEFIKGCDTAIYRNGGMFRLPNTLHTKTGKRKIELESHSGVEKLKLDIVEKPSIIVNCEGNSSIFQDEFILLATYGFEKESRNCDMFKLIQSLKSKNVSNDFVIEFCRQVNKVSYPPLEELELQQLLRYHLRGKV